MNHRSFPNPRGPARRHGPLRVMAATALALSTLARPAAAEEPQTDAVAGSGISWSVSAFASLGWAVANRPTTFQRFIDRSGTWQRDSLAGAQVDLQVTPQWSATAQARLAPSVEHDSRWDLTAAWAFAAWRPGNDWLLRAGKMRAPLFLRSEQLDVGQTYHEARLPSEIYAFAPSNDFTGGNFSRSFALDGGDLGIEVYHGSSTLTKRFWLREGLPPLKPAGATFQKVETTVQGVVGTWRSPSLTARVGLHQARTRNVDGSPLMVAPSWAALGPGIGYWQTSNELPGPGVASVPRIRNSLVSVGADADLGQGWRVAAEWVKVRQHDTELGFDGRGAYVSVYRSLGAFTPYVTLATMSSNDSIVNWVRQLEATRVPAFVPGAAQLNASMRLRADAVPVNVQHSHAVGTSYAVDTRSRIKLEWHHTDARMSSMFDLNAGDAIEARRRIDVLSLSYHIAF